MILLVKIEAEGFKYAKDLIKPFFVKSTDWSYEEEIRCLFSTKDYEKDKISYDGENYFVNVGKIKKIFFTGVFGGLYISFVAQLAYVLGWVVGIENKLAGLGLLTLEWLILIAARYLSKKSSNSAQHNNAFRRR